MIGQEHVTAPLMQALRSNRVNHAYLFSGPRGCGKTTSARILARILNCAQNTEENPTDTPCGQCPSCLELARGGSGSLDVVEIDAASHGGVDDARDLRERATFSPTRDRFKIFILDEAHMVTAQGFNALLKIVEEPPPYLKFIFATTEPDKVIGTIRSRTHHYPFKLVAPEIMNNYLEQLCAAEGIIARDGVLPLVMRAGGGSVRDTLSVLDQLIAGAAGGVLEYDHAVALLGFTPATLLDEVVEALGSRDGGSLFRVVEQVVQTGHEPRRFVEDLLERLRDLVVISLSGDSAAAVLPAVPADQLARMQGQSGMLGAAELSRSADVVNAALTEMSGATSPRLHLELLCARLLLPSADASASGLGARIDGIERAIAGGVPRGGTSTNATISTNGSMSTNSTNSADAIPSGTGQGAGERKSLRPESTRRKPVGPEAATSASDGSTNSGAQSSGVAPGSMFATSAPTGIFGAPPASPPDTVQPTQPQPEPVHSETSTWVATQPQTPQPPAQTDAPHKQPPASQEQPATQPRASETQQPRPLEPELPAQVGVYDGPRDEQGRPLAANTGWHTVDSRQPHAATQVSGTEPERQESAPQQPPTPAQPEQQPQQQHLPAEEAQPLQPNPQPTAQADETEVFKQRWPEVVDALNAMSRATGALIGQHATVEHLDAQTLYLGFPNENLLRPFSARQGDNLVAAAVKNVLGFEVQVIADVQGSPKFPKAGSSTDTAAAAPTDSPRTDTDQVTPHQSAAATTPNGAHSPDEPARTHEPLPSLASQTWQAHESAPQDHWTASNSSMTPHGAGNSPNSPAPSHEPGAQEPDQHPQSREPKAGTGDVPHSDVSLSSVPSQAGQRPLQNSEQRAQQPASEQSGQAASRQPSEPAPFDPLAAVSIFGAAVGAFASTQPNPTPAVPRIGETTDQIVDNLAAQRQTAQSAIPPVASSSTRGDGYSDIPAYDDFPQEPPTDDWGAPAQEADGYGAASGGGSTVSPDITPASGPSLNSPADQILTQSGTSASSPAAATPGQSIPPWEETPRQAAARRAAELAAREAERQQVVDDPQPDDEDLEASNLVGVPLVMSMFGATIIDELTDEA
jgi:DNA polymerase-3 subunit gamma/tau